MPDEVKDDTTPPAADNAAQSTDDPREGASKGIQDRLDRLERNLTKQFEDTKLKPLQEQLDRILAAATAAGVDPASIGIEVPAAQTTTEDTKPADAAEVKPSATEQAEYLRLKAAYDNGLPQEALPLITATDEAGIAAQVASIKALVPKGRPIRVAPIPPEQRGDALPVYKASQLRDAAWFAENSDKVHAAILDGRFDPDS